MKHIKLLLIIGFTFIITNVSFGQVLKFKSSSFAMKFKTESKWAEWSDFEDVSVLIVMDNDDGRFTIYSKEKQVYDVAENEGKETDSDGDDTWSFYCVNEDGNTCRVRLVKLNSQEGRLQLYVDFSDVKVLYNMYSLD